jgi:hypothetical protein
MNLQIYQVVYVFRKGRLCRCVTTLHYSIHTLQFNLTPVYIQYTALRRADRFILVQHGKIYPMTIKYLYQMATKYIKWL